MAEYVPHKVRARVWWNGEQWEGHVPGDSYTFVDRSWQSVFEYAELGMYGWLLHDAFRPKRPNR